MAAKHHCIICGTLIYGGMYCSSCSREIARTRTLDDETLEDWISRIRFSTDRIKEGLKRNIALDYFDSAQLH